MSKSLTFAALLCLAGVLCSNIKINTTTRNFIDSNGRSLLFHGVNVVYKLPPYYPPNLETFDPVLSLCEEDWELLRSWGFNFIRLYMSWEGTELSPGVYNTTYIEQVRSIVRTAAQYNISVLLDAHQDVMSRKFCGEGFPWWALNRSNFPAPLKVNIEYNSEGLANLTECLETPFAEYYFTEAVQAAWWAFYHNDEGLQDHLANFWATVAGYMKDEPNVVAYEIINEPFSSDIYKDPLNIIDSQTDDVKFLQPLYAKVNAAIRPVDNNTILFFEPIVNDLYKVNLNQGPGGPGYNDKQALSFHVYCMDVNSLGQPKSADACHLNDDIFFDSKYNAAPRIGVPAFMTEFGALSNSSGSAEEVNYLTGLADEHLTSWSYWQYKSYNDITTASRPATNEGFFNAEGVLASEKVKALSRSYAYATCGVPLKQKFDPNTGEFLFHWQVGNCNGEATEMFLSEEFYYQNGFDVQFYGCPACQLVSLGATGYYKVVIVGTHYGDISVFIKPKSSKAKVIDDMIMI